MTWVILLRLFLNIDYTVFLSYYVRFREIITAVYFSYDQKYCSLFFLYILHLAVARKLANWLRFICW